MPVVTPYTGPAAARAASVCAAGGRAGRSSSAGSRPSRAPSATRERRPRRRGPRAGDVGGRPVIGTAAWCRPRPPRPAAGSGARRRRRGSTGRGATAGSARRRARGPASGPETTWPSSAYSVSGLSRPVSTCGAQRAEPAGLRLAPVVDDDLVHHVEQVELDGADGAVGHHERAGLHRRGAQQRRGLGQPGRLDEDVGAVEGLLDGVDDRAPGCRSPARSCSPNASRDSSRRLVTRISSRSNSASSMVTLENAVPRAPAWPSTLRPAGRGAWRRPRSSRRCGPR